MLPVMVQATVWFIKFALATKLIKECVCDGVIVVVGWCGWEVRGGGVLKLHLSTFVPFGID